MYLIRFMTMYDCFYFVKTFCTLWFSFEPPQGPYNKHIYSYGIMLPQCCLHVSMDMSEDFYT